MTEEKMSISRSTPSCWFDAPPPAAPAPAVAQAEPEPYSLAAVSIDAIQTG